MLHRPPQVLLKKTFTFARKRSNKAEKKSYERKYKCCLRQALPLSELAYDTAVGEIMHTEQKPLQASKRIRIVSQTILVGHYETKQCMSSPIILQKEALCPVANLSFNAHTSQIFV